MRWMKLVLLATLVQMTSVTPALAEWYHKASGIHFPDTIGPMKRGAAMYAERGDTDVNLEYSFADATITVFIFRSSYPNPALWFDRVLSFIPITVGMIDDSVPTVDFTLANSPRPNGRRANYSVKSGNQKTTALALVQINDWMLKVRITSPTLDESSVNALMDQILEGATFDRPASDPAPLVKPEPCAVAQVASGLPLTRGEIKKHHPSGIAQAIVVEVGERRFGDLVMKPETWCRAPSNLPANLFAAYRQKDGSEFVVLVGDSGRTISTSRVLSATKGDKNAPVGLFGSTPAGTMLIWMFEDTPDLDRSTNAALPVLVGKAENLGFIGVGAAKKKDD